MISFYNLDVLNLEYSLFSVVTSNRLVTKNSCKLNLRNFPLDEQTCHLAFESCKYDQPNICCGLIFKI